MQVRDRVRELRRVRAGDLLPNPKNWRTHPPGQRDALKGLLAEVGYADALLARETDAGLLLIDGHLRAETTPDSLVPVLVLDLTAEEADKLLATLDPLAALATADAGRLDALLRDVQTGSEAVAALLTQLAEDHDVIPAARAADDPGGGGDGFDATPAAEGPCRVSPGDLWLIGGKHRLLCADSTKAEGVARLMGEAKADLVVADPPYGVDFKRGQFITDPSRRGGRARGVRDEIDGDHRKAEGQAEFIRSVFAVAREHSRPAASVYMFSATLAEGSHSMLGLADAGVHIQSQLVWVKNNLVLGIADYQWKHEVCWYGWYEGEAHRWFGDRDKTTVLLFSRIPATFHPHEKPVDLVAHLIGNSSLPGETVYDPFGGSGTTLIAAHRLSRGCCLMELDPAFCEAILKRAEAEGLTVDKLT